MSKKEKIISICLCISITLLIISSGITTLVLKHQKQTLIEIIDELK